MWFVMRFDFGRGLMGNVSTTYGIKIHMKNNNNLQNDHKEYKVKLTAQEIFELKDHHRELMEDTFTYEGALVLGVVDQILNQNKE